MRRQCGCRRLEEVRLLLEHAEDWFRPFIALCAFCGLRLGESCGVQVDDIDFLRRKLHVRRQVQRVSRGIVEIKPPKYNSERTLAAPDELLTMLAQHCEQLEKVDSSWLFPSKYGPPNVVALLWQYAKAVKRSGVDVTLHEFRHFTASGLIAAGLDVVAVQKYM